MQNPPPTHPPHPHPRASPITIRIGRGVNKNLSFIPKHPSTKQKARKWCQNFIFKLVSLLDLVFQHTTPVEFCLLCYPMQNPPPTHPPTPPTPKSQFGSHNIHLLFSVSLIVVFVFCNLFLFELSTGKSKARNQEKGLGKYVIVCLFDPPP